MKSRTERLASRTVGEVVAEDYRLGSVFKQYGIDFCCGGGINVAAACEKRGVNLDELERELATARDGRSGGPAAGSVKWDLDFLADYIVHNHHRYVRESLPALEAFGTKVARVHGHARPELGDISEKLAELAEEMRQHMEKEERILFPFVKQMVNAQRAQGGRPVAPFGTIGNPIGVMEDEHERIGELMAEIRSLSNEFQPPDWACNTYRALFAKLAEFEEDLHWHVHLENNVLFPRTLALEKGEV
jgi:regulator of cell morphogenesis and NO signaling